MKARPRTVMSRPLFLALCALSSDGGSRPELADSQTASNSPRWGGEVGDEQAGHAAPMGLAGVAEIDETYVLESFKG
jgi:hypothetical protein